MVLPAPNLDSRTFQDLMDEAKERIPRYAPEWTNFNPSDPGMALVQLYAWLSETILYDLNQVPDLNYIKFLNLLGVTPHPAEPARGEVTFTPEDLAKPTDALRINVPMGTALSVDDASLEEALTFETDRSLLGLNAHLGAVIAANRPPAGMEISEEPLRRLVTRYDEGPKWLHAFEPFGAYPAKDDCLYLGVLLRPKLSAPLSAYSEDTLPAGPLDLYFDSVMVYDTGPDGTRVEGPLSWHCAGSDAPESPLIEWQLYTGGAPNTGFPDDSDESGWTTLSASRDDTNGLSRAGHVVLELPAGGLAHNPMSLSPAFWDDLGEVRPPQTFEELLDALRAGDIADPADIPVALWEQMGFADPLNGAALLACATSGPDAADILEGLEDAGLAGALDLTKLSASTWAGVNLSPAPESLAELVSALRALPNDDYTALTEAQWQTLGLTDPIQLADMMSAASSAADLADRLEAINAAALDAEDKVPGYRAPNPAALTLTQWQEVNPEFGIELPVAEDSYRPLYWLRARLTRTPGDDERSPLALQAIRLNTAPATQAATVREDRLGVSNGRPGQSVSLRKTPVLIDPVTNAPDLDLTLTGSDNTPQTWQRVDDFYRSGPSDRHYVLDPISGQITFGDGRSGQIPVAGSKITAERYRVGGGAIGNVAPNTITKIKGRLSGVKAATNHRAAHDGSDAESLMAAKARAPHDLRHRDRAVSAEDFRDLALQTPGVNLHKVFALARKAVDEDGALTPRDGAVTLLVLPKTDEDAPQPTQAQQRAICRHLEPRRLITTELHITGPDYSKITQFSANLTVKDGYDLADVTERVYLALLDFLHPIRGGVDGGGWPFGGDIYHGDLYDQMLAVEGVRRVTGLRVALDGGNVNLALDYTPVSEGHLPVLTRDVINLVPSYA